MKLTRSGAAVSAGLVAGALALAGCGSDNNSSSSSSATAGGAASASSSSSAGAVPCGGKKSLKASGSTAQANAMTRFIAAYEAACSGYSLDYTSNGSGAGVKEFTGNQTDFGGSDSPLNADKGEVAAAKQRCGSDAWNLPVVFGPIAVTYNLEGRRQARPRRPDRSPRSSTARSRCGTTRRSRSSTAARPSRPRRST